jgi:hypothetical protein
MPRRQLGWSSVTTTTTTTTTGTNPHRRSALLRASFVAAIGLVAPLLASACTVQPAEGEDDDGTGGYFPPPTGTAAGAGGAAAPPSTTTATPPASTPSTPPATAPAQAGSGASAGDVPIPEPPVQPAAGSAAPPVEPIAGSAAPPPVVIDHGEGDGSDVVTIGDSWMSYLLSGGGIEGALSRAGKDYPGYGVAGTTLLSGQIPGQYTRAKGANPTIATVIMTGGGNDIMFSGGCATPEACKMSVQALSDGLNELWTTMSNDGVKDVVYIRYAKGAGTTNSDNLPTEPPTPPQICITGPIRCTSVDTTDMVMGSLLDGIHPTSAANDRIAAGVLEIMAMKGIRR